MRRLQGVSAGCEESPGLEHQREHDPLDLRVPQLLLGLTLELWFRHLHADHRRQALLVVAAIRRRLGPAETATGGETVQTAQAKHLAFGPRWQVLQSQAFGKNEGLAELLWTVDTQDWGQNQDRQTIRASMRRVSNGAVVLLHDGPVGRQSTWEALSTWLAEAVHQYEFAIPAACEIRLVRFR